MADNSFGIKELNLVGSGTPKIQSPNNINLEAVTVAISTNATVGGNLNVSGVITGDGSGLTGVVGSGSGIAIKHDGSVVGTAGTIDFSTNLDVSAISGAAVTITASGGGIGTDGSINTTGIITASQFHATDKITVGSGVTIDASGQAIFTGIITSKSSIKADGGNVIVDIGSLNQGFYLKDSGSTHLAINWSSSASRNYFRGNSGGSNPLTFKDFSAVTMETPLTVSGDFRVGTGATIEANGQASFAGIITASNGIFVPEGERLTLGSGGQDFRIYNDSKCRIITAQGGDIEIGGTTDAGNNYEYGFRYVPDNQVELTFNGSKKFETTNTGVSVTGTITGNGFVKTGGTSSQYLMADGSVSTGGGGGITIQDEGSGLSTQATTLNFVGSGVVASGTGATKTITISGGGGGSGTTINNNANNRVITGSNSANTLEAESSLTYDGTYLTAPTFTANNGAFYGPTKVILFGGIGGNTTLYSGGSSYSDHIFTTMQSSLTRENFRIGSSGQIGLGGGGSQNYGTSGQVLTSGGAAAAASWQAVSNRIISSWAVTANLSSAYRFSGPGNLSTQDNPTIHLVRGQKYEFNLNASSHPFHIQTVSGAYSFNDLYTTGVTNAGAAVGTITFDVPMDAPNTLYYVCQNHSTMAGTIDISSPDDKIQEGNSSIEVVDTGTGHIKFTTDGTEKIRIRSDGNLGLGFDNPLAKIHAVGSNPSMRFVDNTANATFIAGANASDVFIGSSSNHPLLINTNNSEKLRIDTDGQIGLSGQNYGNAGEVITSQGSSSAPTWASPHRQITTLNGTTSQINDDAYTTLNITGYKAYSLFKINSSHEAWVRIYVDSASRTADTTRSEGQDPLPGSGLIAEMRTSGNDQTVLVTPGAFGFNNQGTNDIYVSVNNRSGSPQQITVTLTLIQIGE